MIAQDQESIIKLSPDNSDVDGVNDYVDNCVSVNNPMQRDTDADGYGNFCDWISITTWWLVQPTLHSSNRGSSRLIHTQILTAMVLLFLQTWRF